MADLQLLQRLCEIQGVSGAEDAVRSLILDEIRPFADKVEATPLGNLIVQKRGRERARTQLVLDAHMDEVGLIITYICDDGLLKFSTAGGIDPRVLCGRPVTLEGGLAGVIGAKPIHLMEKDEQEKSVPVKDLYIDIGARDGEQARKAVEPGTRATFDSIFDASHGKIKSRALDDRAGCAVLVDLIKTDLAYDATFVFAVQEETGLSGSRTAAFAARPQAAIVLESTTAADIPGVPEEKQVCRVGQGPVVSFMDSHTVYDREYYKMAFAAARELGLPCQAKQAVAGGNDAGAIHASRGGVRTVALSLPCRYLHAACGLIAQSDFHAMQKLAARLAEQIAGQPPV